MDLAITCLVQWIIDQGIAQKDPQLILGASLLMLGISLVNTLFAEKRFESRITRSMLLE